VFDAAWLLVAIELNGALVSKGAQAALNDHHCAVEMQVMAPLLAPLLAPQIAAKMAPRAIPEQASKAKAWITDASHCSLDAAEGVLRIRLPQKMLAEKTLALSEPSGEMGIALLHDPALLAGLADYSAQPMPKAIPSMAFDVFLGSDLNGLGSVIAHGPWSASFLYQTPSQGPSTARLGTELFFENGAQLRAGDLRAERGPEQVFGEYRGLHLASRAQVLKGNGKAEALLPVQSPSRVQFLDRNGMAIYSSEMLPPGNYRVQGYAASAVPGFLQAQLIDVNGSVQLVSLPWTADRRLVLQGDTEWDLLAGYPRQLAAGLGSPPVIAAAVKHGLTASLTTGADLERAGHAYRGSLSATSSAIGGALATAALGQRCSHDGCDASWLAELRTSLGSRWHASLSAQQTADIVALTATPIAIPTAATIAAPVAAQVRSARLHVTGQLHPDIHGSVSLARTMQSGNATTNQGSRQIATIAASLRMAPTASVQLQARHHLLPTDASSWSGFVGVTLHFAKERTTISAQAIVPSPGSSSSAGMGMQAAYGGGALYGPQLSLAHQQGMQSRSDMYARYASPYGDASLRTDTFSDRASWSASTRLWVTAQGATLAPTGEDNLVIQRIGMSDVKLSHAGRDAQVSDAGGMAMFRKAPSWTDAIYAIDPASIPFGAQLSASRIRVPLAANRAYLIDYRHLWSQSRSWKMMDMDAMRAARIKGIVDRAGLKVFVSEDGYADLQSIDQLPLTIATERQGPWRCERIQDPAGEALLSQEIALQCVPHVAL
jgi:hypothetical protein